MAAATATYLACFIDHSARLAKGEVGYVLCLSASRDQASLVHNYIRGLLEASPVLAARITHQTQDEITIDGNICIATHSNSYRTVRGRTMLAVVFDETALWHDENSANPDVEVYRAVRPGLMTTRGMLIGISTPYRRSGLLYERFRDYYNKSDPNILVVKGPSTAFNPTLDKADIELARKSDPILARSEFDCEWRDDIGGFISREVLEAAIVPGLRERLPERGQLYVGFIDPAGGSAHADSMTAAIAHAADGKLILDALAEARPPFSPDAVCAEFCELFRRFGVSVVEGPMGCRLRE
jgi:hypothetical protein